MKIVPFPQSEGPPDEQTLAEIEAALRGEAVGADAEGWRALRADVRTLAPVMSPEFERRMREVIEARPAPAPQPRPRRAHGRPASLRAWLAATSRVRGLALAATVTATVVAAVLLAAPWQGGGQEHAAFVPDGAQTSSASRAYGSVRAQPLPTVSAPAVPLKSSASTEAAGESGASGGESRSRIQQRAATLTLAPKPEAVQSIADQVAQLTVREGGFVQSSQVHRQSGAGGSADLRLSLPSARLSAALASLARLAPTREESQSLQDITDEYGAARRKLADAVAERQALLRALARASTQSQIESLHARIALASAAVSRARNAFGAISRRAGNSTVEVDVLGDAHAGSERSTLGTGLHDALDVLEAVAVVLLIALAVLVPLAILAASIAIGWRASRRRLRERALS